MKTPASKVLGSAIAAAALLPALILTGATLPVNGLTRLALITGSSHSSISR